MKWQHYKSHKRLKENIEKPQELKSLFMYIVLMNKQISTGKSLFFSMLPSEKKIQNLTHKCLDKCFLGFRKGKKGAKEIFSIMNVYVYRKKFKGKTIKARDCCCSMNE